MIGHLKYMCVCTATTGCEHAQTDFKRFHSICLQRQQFMHLKLMAAALYVSVHTEELFLLSKSKLNLD